MMARLAAAHRALTQLYDDGAEATVDYLLAEAILMCLNNVRKFSYIDPLGGAWVMIEIWQPCLTGGCQWAYLIE